MWRSAPIRVGYAVAREVEEWLKTLRKQLDRHRILEAIVCKQISLVEAYRYGEAGG